MAVDLTHIQLQMALAALGRIVRKRAGFHHNDKPQFFEGRWVQPETCDCPQCIAKSALEQIYDLEKEKCLR